MQKIVSTGLCLTFGCCNTLLQAQENKRPNIIFLLADDMRYDVIGSAGRQPIVTPELDRLAQDGCRFTNMYVTTSISCTSRASVFTGQYAHMHGIHDFGTDFTPEQLKQTYPLLLRAAGYVTGFIGKYGVGNRMPIQEFDYWRGFAGQGNYYQKDNEGNDIHLTRLISSQIFEFLESRDTSKPFCLSVSFKAPHSQDGAQNEFPYDQVYKEMYRGIEIFYPETFGEEYWNIFPQPFRQDGKWENEARVRWRKRFGTDEKYQLTVKAYYRLVAGIDETIGKLRRHLKENGLNKNTIIIFTSDNGFYLGEHGMAGKWFGHEESIRLPLLIYDPRKPQSGRQEKAMVLNIDMAPTILEYAGVKIPGHMQGKSLLPLLDNKNPGWRKAFYYEYLMHLDKKGWYVFLPQVEGVVGERYKYMRYFKDNQPENLLFEEIYDIRKDPFEKYNLAGKQKLKRKLEKHFRELKNKRPYKED